MKHLKRLLILTLVLSLLSMPVHAEDVISDAVDEACSETELELFAEETDEVELPPFEDDTFDEAEEEAEAFSDFVPIDAMMSGRDYTLLSNDKEYLIQGKVIKASMVGNYNDCWNWARALYKIIWGTYFTSDYQGTAETGLNLIRNLTDAERQLTGENLRNFIGQSEMGCTLRICSCPSSCSYFKRDGCPNHEKHSLIVVDKDAKGMVVMDNMTGSGSVRYTTRYYTWDNFAKHWAKYKMIKYIKWPNAPVYDKGATMPTGISLNTDALTLKPGETATLTASVQPEEASRSVTWHSDNTAVATVNSAGKVTAAGIGSAVITATTINGLTAKVSVIVSVEPEKVALNYTGTVTMGVGTTLQLNATLSPSGAQSDLMWKSTKTKVASVSSSGLIKAKKAGTATVGVATANGKVAKIKVKVVKSNRVTKVKLNKSGTLALKVGEKVSLAAKLTPLTARTALLWKSTNEKVAVISQDGAVTAVAPGTCTVGVITSNKKYATVKIRVTQG